MVGNDESFKSSLNQLLSVLTMHIKTGENPQCLALPFEVFVASHSQFLCMQPLQQKCGFLWS